MIRLAPSPRDMPSIAAYDGRSPRSAGGLSPSAALSPTAARRRMNAAGRGGQRFWSESHPEFLAAEVPTAPDAPGKDAAPAFRLQSPARGPAASPRFAPAAPGADDSSVVSAFTPKIVMKIETASQQGGWADAGAVPRQARQPTNSRGSQRLPTVADGSGSGSGSASTATPREGGGDAGGGGDDGGDENVPGSNNTTPAQSPSAKAKSKKMVVVDPRSGKKYQLKADDSSPPCLTDKELHVYHKQRRGAGAAGGSAGRSAADASGGSGDGSSDDPSESRPAASERRHRRTSSVRSEAYTAASTECASESFQTLETASALTDVSYYGRNRAMCMIPTSCHSIEQLALRDIKRGERDPFLEHDDDDEMRDVDGGRGRARARGLRVDTASGDGGSSEGSGRGSPLGAAIMGTAAALLTPLGAAARHFLEPSGASHVIMPAPGNVEVVEIKFRRLCLVVFPEEFLGSLKDGDTLLGMKLRQDPEDFQAHVATVRRGSRADKLGVKRGDVVSVSCLGSTKIVASSSAFGITHICHLDSVGLPPCLISRTFDSSPWPSPT